MKQFNKVKGLMLAAIMGGTGVVQAQVANTAHPAAFQIAGSTAPINNFYKDYVGSRMQVSSPASIAGDYVFTTANNGSGGTTQWGGYIDTMTTPMVDIPIYMPSGSTSGNDSLGCSGFLGTTASDMYGKIAVIWRGDCEFGQKAAYAQSAGARAIIIINQMPGEGPVGMGAGAVGTSVTIPVFMVGNLDGMKIAGQYRGLPPGSVKMTIIPWGKGLANDLGFVPGGVSVWHNCAIPASQLAVSPTPSAYKAINGAFIANYGTADQINVRLATNVSFTPTSGSVVPVHSDVLTVTPSVSSDTFKVTDSIYAVFGSEYDLTGSGTGRYDINYRIIANDSDMFNYDNMFTHSFFATNDVYSKGRYDFTNNHPIATAWFSPSAPYMWGVPYYVAKGGDVVKDIQFSVSSGPGPIDPTVPNINFYVFKWKDGAAGGGSTTPDGAIEGGELDLVGAGTYAFAPTDSSFSFFNVNINSDTDFSSVGFQVPLEDTTWYFVSAEVPGSTSLALGNDGIISAYPRSYGREHFHGNTEIYNPIFGGDKPTMRANPTAPFLSYTFGGGSFDVDSVVYNSQNGLIPALAMRVKPFNVGVNTVAASSLQVNLFPNPATNQLNVSLDLATQVKTVSFTILNTAGQVVARETKNNVQKEQFSFSTSNFASGNYFMVINADGKQMHRKFTVIK